MKLSIIVPCKNSGSTVNRALDSIRMDLPSVCNLEILLVPSTPDDSTYPCIKNKENVRWLTFGRHVGLGESRKLGLECSSGDYIGFLDSDDFYGKNCISSVAERFAQDPSLDLVVGEVFVQNESGASCLSPSYPNLGSLDSTAAKDAFLSSRQLWWQVGAFFAKKSFLVENGITFNPLLSANEDLPVLASMVCLCRHGVTLDVPFVYYCPNSSGAHVERSYANLFDSAVSLKSSIVTFQKAGLVHAADRWSIFLVKELLLQCGRSSTRNTRKQLSKAFRRCHLLKGIHPTQAKSLFWCFRFFGYRPTWLLYSWFYKIKHRKETK